mgnify:CR=1 FL=1|tara:strand:- start:5725 stop:5922 length:198 start_codon:yes stop_codon:yes gene_type:complete
MSLFNNIEEVEEQEFCWNTYQQEVIQSNIKKYITLENAVVAIDAEIASLRTTIECLKDLIDWESE